MNGTIKPEPGIPFIKGSGKQGCIPKYPWRTMDIGDSFLFPDGIKTPHSQAHMANAIYRPKRFAARTTPDGVRCWRVE